MITALYYAGDNCAYKGDRECVIHMKFERGFGVIISMVRKNIEESPNEVKAFASDIRHLEDGTDSLADKLSCSLNGIFAIFDKNRNLTSTWRFQDSSDLRDGLLEDLWGADVDFSDDDHYRHIECEGNS